MSKYKQLLNDKWYARTEPEGVEDIAPYCACYDGDSCVPTDIPALVKDLFPTASTPIWYYKTFRNELSADEYHRIYLSFDRVVCLCEAYVNGVKVGKHVHSEEKFEFDITDALREGENLIALRVYGPIWGKEGIDGIAMNTMPNFAQVYSYYTVIPMTGIYGGVSLIKKPICAIKDIYVNPCVETKSVSVELTLENGGRVGNNAEIEYKVYDKGMLINSLSDTLSIEAGKVLTSTVNIPMKDVRLWSPDDPYLYTLSVSVKTPLTEETQQKRFGFKSLCVEEGWFMLNGKRTWLTCAHAIESKEAVVHAKAMGFKALRYLTAMPSEEILDFCDEVGMMVYEECAVAWGMQDYPEMPDHMSAYLDNMIRRDRSHVSVGIWGIFNEQAGPNKVMRSRKLADTAKVFDFAVSYLPKMRRLDNTRLILLSSGRWDARADIGSFSNPGSSEWNFGWGGEAPDAQLGEFKKCDQNIDPYISPMGDNHVYPTVPLQNDVRNFVRNIGKGTKPVFLSEYGVGTQMDLHDLYFDQVSTCHKDHPSVPYYRIQMKRLDEWIEKYGMAHVYPSPRDFLMASVCAGAEQRRESIDPIRANPQLCGYSLTSFTISNEGVYYRNGSFIPGIVDALRDSFAPLKWSIFMDKTQMYAGEPFEIEVVLCNEDALPAGDYSAVLSITGSDGVAFRKSYSFVYPEGKPLAASVIRAEIDGLPADKYTVSVWLNDHRQPTCDKKSFRVHELSGLPRLNGSIYTVGDMGRVEDLLRSHGMTVASSAETADMIVVGKLSDGENRQKEILSMALNGKRVIILDGRFWESANTSAQEFMQSIDYSSKSDAGNTFGNCIYVRNWLYHLDSYIADKKVFDGLADIGLLDMDLFRRVYPDRYLIDTAKPKKTYCASFGSGLFAKDNCISALAMGEFELGKGSVTVNTFKLLENAGADPIADRMIYNLFNR